MTLLQRIVIPVATEADATETKTAYGTDVVETLFETAEEADATAIVSVPRSGSRLVRLLSGDTSIRLVAEGPSPVVSIPEAS